MGGCPRVHIHLRRIPMSSVPDTEEAFKLWMHELFVKKDRSVICLVLQILIIKMIIKYQKIFLH